MHIALFNKTLDKKIGLTAFASAGYATRSFSQLFSVLSHEPQMKRRIRQTDVKHQ